MFQLTFPDAVRLVDMSRRVVYKQGKTWSLLKLPSPSSAGTEKFATGPSFRPIELPGEIEAGHPWAMIFLAAALVVATGSIFLLHRKRVQRLRAIRGS